MAGWRWWRRRRPTSPPVVANAATTGRGAADSPTAVVAPSLLVEPAEAYCRALAQALAVGQRFEAMQSDDLKGHLDALWRQGHERAVLGWLEKLFNVPQAVGLDEARREAWEVGRAELAWMLAQRHEARRDVADVVRFAAPLLDVPAYTLRARALLGDVALRSGQPREALRHYEGVLAIDITQPNMLDRVERLRAQLGRGSPMAGPTLEGSVRGIDTGGRYRLLRELGRGSTGAVYAARDEGLGREVALKLLHPQLARRDHADVVAQFFVEARVAAALRHPNIVGVLDIDEGARRIVMELGVGGTLKRRLQRGALPLRGALERYVQLLSALRVAHAQGVIHRDIKPANLLFRRDPDEAGAEIMLGDFGVAWLPGVSPQAVAAAGTLAYMAPEQRAGQASTASDLYACGLVVVEMVLGRLPALQGQLASELLLQVPPPEPSARAAWQACLHRLGAHVDQVLAPTPQARPTVEAALAIAHELRALAMHLPSER